MLTIIQWAAILFAAFAWSRAVLRFKDHKISVGEFAFWSGIWIAVVLVALLPGIAAFISTWAGIRRPIDIAVYAGIVLLFYLIFRVYVRMEQINKDVTQLTREISLHHAQMPRKR